MIAIINNNLRINNIKFKYPHIKQLHLVKHSNILLTPPLPCQKNKTKKNHVKTPLEMIHPVIQVLKTYMHFALNCLYLRQKIIHRSWRLRRDCSSKWWSNNNPWRSIRVYPCYSNWTENFILVWTLSYSNLRVSPISYMQSFTTQDHSL